MFNRTAVALTLILIGAVSLLGIDLGYHQVWFVFPIIVGIATLLWPAEGSAGSGAMLHRRQVGFWSFTVGIISALVYFTSLTWGQVGPLYMIAAGLYGILFHGDWFTHRHSSDQA